MLGAGSDDKIIRTGFSFDLERIGHSEIDAVIFVDRDQGVFFVGVEEEPGIQADFPVLAESAFCFHQACK